MDDYISKPVRPEELQRALAATAAEMASPSAPTDVDPEAAVSAAVDRQVLANLRELQEPDEPDFVVELIDHLLAETPVRLASIGEAIAAGNAQSLNRLAHSLKSSCGNLGAMHLSSLCQALERAGADNQLEPAPALLAQAHAEFERVKAALDLERGGATVSGAVA